MTTVGSTYSTLKAAILSTLEGRTGLSDVALAGAPPVDALKLRGPSGSGKAIWIADADGDLDATVFVGAGSLHLDETYDLTVVLQALPSDTDDSQAVTDQRVDEMLGEVLTAMAGDPTWGVTGFARCEIASASFRRFAGPVTDRNLYPSRCELDLHVEARIIL